MNSFRVLNARFRILKGGKIGLSLSIFLLGSMLTLSKTNALATDYFTGVQSTFGSFTTNTSGATPGSAKEITVQTATNSGLTTATRTESTYNAVIFNPISWANSFYSTPTYTGNSGGYYDYTLNTTSSDLNLSLTFASGANALGILKDNTTIYSASIIGPVSIKF